MHDRLEMNTQTAQHAPIVFIGFGVATDITIHVMESHNLLKDGMVIYDLYMAPMVHKTLCFWSDTESALFKTLQHCIEYSWNKAHTDQNPPQNLEELQYHQMSAHSLRASTMNILRKYKVHFHQEEVLSLESKPNQTTVLGTKTACTSALIFDSRPLPARDGILIQSFTGYTVILEEPKLQTESICLMDFDMPQDEHTQFMYVLPYSKTQALCECTRFGTEKLPEPLARQHVEKYVREKYGNAQIHMKETGVIPMHPIEPASTPKHVIAIGGRAGMIKPSTGYAVQFMFDHATNICRSQLSLRASTKRVQRFQFYDALLISILTNKPHLGRPIFRKLFTSTSMETVFRFLSERTNIQTEAQIFLKLPIPPFLKTAIQHIGRSTPELSLLVCLSMIVFIHQYWPNLANPILILLSAIGMVAIGIPHGALDHKVFHKPIYSPSFLTSYIGLMLLVGVGWFLSPTLALTFFLVGSAWHFGETEFNELRIRNRFTQLVYGALILSCIILPHAQEAAQILFHLRISIPNLSMDTLQTTYSTLILGGFSLSLYHKSIRMVLSVGLLMMLGQLPLLYGFFLFFIFRHSTSAWSHLRERLHLSSTNLFIAALPFSIGAWALLSIWLYTWPLEQIASWFFVFLSCVTIPHIFCMTYLYNNEQAIQKA